MSQLENMADNLKRKTSRKNLEKSTLQKVNTSKHLVKHTVYLSPQLSQKLKEFHAKRILKGIEENKYDIICDAIESYIEREEKKDN